ncbi:MAG: phenylalanine--tRNA ligase subunit beta [Elusimicrobiales bacterium]
MKIVYSWLCDYLLEKPSIDVIISELKRLGFGVESVERIGPNCNGVVTAKVVKVEKHPNADKLSICKVKTLDSDYDVVCGAKNVKEGIIVAFAPVGAVLKGIMIKKAKIRGVESNGMICSAQEIGIGEESDGIMILDDSVKIGMDIREIFDSDYVIDLDITPNLAYCLSHYGIARELSIFCGYKIKNPDVCDIRFLQSKDFPIFVETDLCLRYAAIAVSNIKNKQTPIFITDRLKKAGINPKGNLLIDLSNYVMLDIGQPNHFFDLKKIDSIIVRNAKNGERFKALDGNEYELSDNMTVISDSKKVLAVGGVIGGLESSVDDKTEEILIEIANFKPEAVRVSSKKIGVKSDSSYRFERGVDFNLVELASKRILYILLSTNPQLSVLFAVDIKNKEYPPVKIEVNSSFIEEIIGIKVDEKKLNNLLSSLDSSFDGRIFTVPSYRYDITSLWDLSEEYLRYVGYDSVLSKTSMPCIKSADDPYLTIMDKVSNRLSKFSFNECYTYDLVSEKDIRSIGFDPSLCLRVINPLSKDFEFLRPCGIPSMLKVLRYNINRDINSVKIYEFGSIFSKDSSGMVDEKRSLFILMWGCDEEIEWWKEKNLLIDFFHLKTTVDSIMDRNVLWLKSKHPSFLYVCDLIFNRKKIGFAGALNPTVLKSFDIKEKNVFYAEIETEKLIEFYSGDFYQMVAKPQKPSQYQHSMRDLSIIVDKKFSFSQIYETIKNTENISDIRLIDVYEDDRIGRDKRSLTFRFIFSSTQKTFTDNELNAKIEEIFNILRDRFSATLR